MVETDMSEFADNNLSCWSPEGREASFERLRDSSVEWDIIVVGGGITGAGVYREALHRGLKVLLVDQQDFAWGTSSRSSKMVHGGLRYLGSGQFGLANDSVKERQQLMNQLPGLIDPLPFLMGHYKGRFPGPWIFDKLLAIYDWMAGKRYRRYISDAVSDYWVPGIQTSQLKGVTQFADAVTDDARLVLRVLQEGNREGGLAINYLKAIDTLRSETSVTGLRLQDQATGEQFLARSKVVVNATGAWTDDLRASLGKDKVIRPLRGSHLVVPFWRLPCAFSVSFFHPADNRPVFVFPWEGVTVIGTTDLDHSKDMASEAAIDEHELHYLLEAANSQFPETSLAAKDVLSTWSGVRPVVSKKQDKAPHKGIDQKEDGKNAKPSDEKREHAIWNDNGLISVAGGKLTTYRLIALDVLKEAQGNLGDRLDKVSIQQTTDFHIDRSGLDKLKPWSRIIGASSLKRLIGRWGSQLNTFLSNVDPQSNLLKKISTTDTLWIELKWSCEQEAIVHLDDLLLRRTRIGLLIGNGGEEIFEGVRDICMSCLGWDQARWKDEVHRYRSIIARHYSLPFGLNAKAEAMHG